MSATPALAAAPELDLETLSVEDVWLTGDTLHISVMDEDSGEKQTLELNLSDYAKFSDEYVTVQATDSTGRISNTLQFKNPYYQPSDDKNDSSDTDNSSDVSAPDNTDNAVDSAISDGGNPFTPDGTGTVIDNATDGDGKEFFTVETPDGNVFYLIVDRERTSENVYLLNAVTENDLASLAKPGDGMTQIAVVTPEQPPVNTAPPEPDEQPPIAPPVEEKNGDTGTIVFIVIAVAVVGGAGYYIKIVRPKQNGGADSYDDEPEDYDDEEYDLDNSEEGDDE